MNIWDKWVATILIELLNEPGDSLRGLSKRTSINTTTLHNKLVELEKAGYITDEFESGFPPKRQMKLTKKGKEIARHVKAIDEKTRE